MLFIQLVLAGLFVRYRRTLEAGWLRAGVTRRSVVKMWATAFVLSVRHSASTSRNPITDRDMFVGGIDRATKEDMARVYEKLGQWLDYWSVRHPSDTLQQAMLNLMVRLWKTKDGWIAERGSEQFPFLDAMDGIVAGKLEGYVDGKV